MEQDRWSWFTGGVVLGLLIGAGITGVYLIPQLSEARAEAEQKADVAMKCSNEALELLVESRKAKAQAEQAVLRTEKAEEALNIAKKNKQDTLQMLALLGDFFSSNKSPPLFGKPAPALPIPAVGAVDRLVLTPRVGVIEGQVVANEVVVKDAKRIERLLVFLGARNERWWIPFDTFPAGQWSISLNKGNECLLLLWVGSNFLAGREGSGGSDNNRLRSLSAKDHAELYSILGLP